MMINVTFDLAKIEKRSNQILFSLTHLYRISISYSDDKCDMTRNFSEKIST
jgi:hypothetical protein